MGRSLHIAAVQLAAHSRASFADAWPRISARIGEAAATGAQLAVLPEGTLPAYVLGHERFDGTEIERAIQECRTLAQQHEIVLVVGAARHTSRGVYNSAVVIDRDGSIAGYADKHFLWHFDRQWFAPAETIAPIRTSIGTIGALVCADGRIPTIASTLVDRGAELLVMPTAWVTSGRDPQQLENVQADLLARVRARENGVPFVAANKCGVELHCVAYCGKSQILSATGETLAAASQDREETIVAHVPLEIGRPYRARSAAVSAEFDHGRAQRVAISSRLPRDGDDRLLKILEADVFLSGGTASAGDDVMLDPGALPELRMRGDALIAWQTQLDPQWHVTFARARALELRMYVVVVDRARERAYAVDPDGTIVCGTFGEYEIASFAFDPAKTRQTAVAPGTDVLQGLQRAATHAL